MLVQMDCHMPIMDGLTATETIRRWESENAYRKHARLPILALTAEEGAKPRSDCLDVSSVAKPDSF